MDFEQATEWVDLLSPMKAATVDLSVIISHDGAVNCRHFYDLSMEQAERIRYAVLSNAAIIPFNPQFKFNLNRI